MIFSIASRSFSQMFRPEMRRVFWKSLGSTVLLLIASVVLIQNLADSFLVFDMIWLDTAIAILTGVGLVVGAGFLIAPIMTVFAGLFLDDVAAAIEDLDYPHDPPGEAMPLGASIAAALRFLGLVALVNLIALILLLVPGVNLIIFFVANGYLLGREYFHFVARRFLDEREATSLRKANGGRVFVAGLLMAAMLAVPLLNLLTPLFATVFMVHLYKRAAR